MRKVCTLELLSTKMIKSFDAIRKDELSTLISSILPGSPVNLTEQIFFFTLSVLCRSAFGKRLNDQGELIELINHSAYIAGFNVADFFLSSKLLHKLCGVQFKLVILHQKLDAVEDILNEHIEHKLLAADDQFGGEDLVDVLLRIKEDDIQHQFPITNDCNKAVMLGIFAAGAETSSTIVKNPNIMAEVQSEVRQVYKGNNTYDVGDLEKLTNLNLVIKETLRLHPDGTHGMLGDGYLIPNETRVLVNVWALAMDSEYWHEPKSFIPERFENSSANLLGNHFDYIPSRVRRRRELECNFQRGLRNRSYICDTADLDRTLSEDRRFKREPAGVFSYFQLTLSTIRSFSQL